MAFFNSPANPLARLHGPDGYAVRGPGAIDGEGMAVGRRFGEDEIDLERIAQAIAQSDAEALNRARGRSGGKVGADLEFRRRLRRAAQAVQVDGKESLPRDSNIRHRPGGLKEALHGDAGPSHADDAALRHRQCQMPGSWLG